jgi:uncharacterized protein YkwD
VRAEAHLEPLKLSETLCRAAQARAQEIEAAGNLDSVGVPGEDTVGRAAREGYKAAALSQIVTQDDGDPAFVIGSWQRQSDATLGELSKERHRDLGVGMAALDGEPLYVVLLGVAVQDDIAIRTRGIRDPARVRAALLDAVNRERSTHRLPPLRANITLEKVAQRHADDMLARGYYGHASPEGTMVLARTKWAGYVSASVGENIAKGQVSVEDVMGGWMNSPKHRENILNPFFFEAGFGLAIGKEGDQVLWVQVFGEPRAATRRR